MMILDHRIVQAKVSMLLRLKRKKTLLKNQHGGIISQGEAKMEDSRK